MGIARRTASETEYRLQLLLQADYINEKAFNSMETDRLEIFKMPTSIVKSFKENE
jgi:four helix bundle protein